MATTIPPGTNLRERIAAIEQKNHGGDSRATSPAPPTVASGGSAVGNALKDKIAKFEKKGGVPVPRGAFGLGAPPPPEARVKKRGELYGNRIPRAVSGGGGPPSRSGSSLGFYNNPSPDLNSLNTGSLGRNRPVSMNSEISDLNDDLDYTPLNSPTFNYPDSPGGSTVYSPDGSPTFYEPAEVVGRGPITSRSTSFAKAIELAKQVAENGAANGGVGGGIRHDGATPTPFMASSPPPMKQGSGEAGTSPVSHLSPTRAQSDEAEAIFTSPTLQKIITEEANLFTDEPTRIEDSFSDNLVTSSTPFAPVQIVIASVDETPASPPTPRDPQTPSVTDTSNATNNPVSTTPDTPTTPGDGLSNLKGIRPMSQIVLPTQSQHEDFQQTFQTNITPLNVRKLSASRNNKDLSLDVDALDNPSRVPMGINSAEPSAGSQDETTPTTASYPNPNMLLSPPVSGVSSVLSSGSIGSGSMISPRPFSMVELSWAERVTPATSRGNVMFIPPNTASNTQTRKSSLFFPPTPTEEEKAKDIKAPSDSGASTKPEAKKPVKTPMTFTAVVHKKVREQTTVIGPSEIPPAPSNAPTAFPTTPIGSVTPKRQKRMTMMVPPSPGAPELFSLIQNAVMLESTLENGELPTEAAQKKVEAEKAAAEEAEREKQKRLIQALSADKRRAEQEEQKKSKVPPVPPLPKDEDTSTAGKLRHTFLIPLSKARSQHRKEVSTSDADAYTAAVATNSGRRPKSSVGSGSVRLPGTPEVPVPPLPEVIVDHEGSPPGPTPKSAGSHKSRFSSFRRLGSGKSVLASSRQSMASDMSDDPYGHETPEGSIMNGEFDEFGMAASGQHGANWPSVSPTKKGGSLSRASTFAGKMFSRSRTKSSGSTLSNASGNSRAASVYTLPPLPDSLAVIPPSPEFETTRQPRRSISMKSLKSAMKGRASTDTPPLPQGVNTTPKGRPPPVTVTNAAHNASVPSAIGSVGTLKSPDYIGYNSLNPPLESKDRPVSWVSVSSLSGSLPSPLFEKDIFDAFPAVPVQGNNAKPYRSGSLGPGAEPLPSALVTPSFDSAFLGSAIHLAGSHKSTHNSGVTPTATGFRK
ncbi:hypothetical protein FA15DRAFT_494212 [Coprinopsis marcescibilis]|uniref:Uncharacterized protein n=1 Tax=Coprinopsis marcescibilis TaxID=230819 RepID=A0A5C3KQV9_COPMA|nr:hypothetical protein FA15DRAFT_494212 [Coprinopsis marcescibilis]